MRSAALAGVALLAALPLAAHPLSASYSRFSVGEGGVLATLRLPLDDMDLLLRLDADLDEEVAPEELEAARDRIAGYLDARVELKADGGHARASLLGLGVWRDGDGFPHLEARLRYPAPGPVDTLAIQVRVLTDLYADHRNLAEIEYAGRRDQFLFQHGGRYEGARGAARLLRTAREFVLLGVEHIFTGYDHLLFLFGLLLVGRGLRDLVLIVTSFTVAHSLTLALATLGWLHPSGRLIEAAIALSIAYVGLENLLVREVRHRWRLTFAFGLVHGFGFASVLQEMELPRSGLAVSLLTFNLGVELGQVAIVAALWPLLRLLQRSPHRVLVTRLASSLIVAMGLYWLQQRVS